MLLLKRALSGHGGLPGIPVLMDIMCMSRRGMCHDSAAERVGTVGIMGSAVVKDRRSDIREMVRRDSMVKGLPAVKCWCVLWKTKKLILREVDEKKIDNAGRYGRCIVFVSRTKAA